MAILRSSENGLLEWRSENAVVDVHRNSGVNLHSDGEFDWLMQFPRKANPRPVEFEIEHRRSDEQLTMRMRAFLEEPSTVCRNTNEKTRTEK